MCVSLLESCVLVGLDWAEPMTIFLLHVTWPCIIHAFSFLIIGTLCDWHFSVYLSISLSLSLLMAPKRKSAPSQNPLRFEASSSNPTPLSVQFCDEKTHQDFSENFSRVAFIWNATWFYQIFLILLYLLSFIVDDGNLYVRYPWAVPLWSYRSSTPICTVSIPLYLGLLYKFKVYVS